MLAVGGWLALSASLAAQQRRVRFDRISIEDGLSQETVTCLIQDRVGFMWFGTQDGLNRFDGNSFVAFKHDPDYPATLLNDYVQALAEDVSGDIWVGTRGGGLSRWHRRTDGFTHYRHDADDPGSLSDNLVTSLLQDSRDMLWVGTERTGLNRLEPSTGRVDRFRHDPKNPSSLGDDRVRAMLEDSRGRLWVATLGGLELVDRSAGQDPGDWRFRHFRQQQAPVEDLAGKTLSILEASDGRLWLGTFGGLLRFDPDAGSFERFVHDPAVGDSLSEGRVRALYLDSDDRLWIGTDGGLDLWQPERSAFLHHRHAPEDPHSLSANRVSAVFQDRGGVLWVGCQRGVNKWNPSTWAFSPYRDAPAKAPGLDASEVDDSEVLAISEDADGRIWLGTAGDGVERVDRVAGEIRRFRHDPAVPSSLAGNRVTALAHDRRGVLWVGTLTDGLDRFDRRTETFRHYRHDPQRDDSLGADGVMAIFEDSSERLWVGTFGGGLNRVLDRSADGPAPGRFERFVHDPEDPASLSNDRVTSFAEASDGRLWIGTFEGGLNRFDPESGVFVRYRSDAGVAASLSSDMIFSTHVGADGTLWVGTQIGLNRLARVEAPGAARFEVYSERDGLPNDVVYGIHPDAAGRLWLATNKGLSRFDPATGSFKNYDVSHGLQSNEFHMGAHFRSASGELFFGGVEGWNAFFPDRIEVNDHVPPVVLTAFSKLDQPVDMGRPIFDVRTISLDHSDSIVSFEFAALDYAAPHRNRYRYRLEGFNDDWIDLGNRRHVSFTNLDPGSYVLRVMGSNNDGVWNGDGLSIAIDVAPPPWRTWWAYALYALALVASVGGFVRSQQAKVERERAQVTERERLITERERLIAELENKNTELERFNYTVSHDLKSPLVTIKGFVGLLAKDVAAGDEERVRHDVGRISVAADRMYRLLEELLELSRVGHQVDISDEVPLSDVVAEAVEIVHGLIAERRVDVRVAGDLPVVSGDRGRLVEVFCNLLSNAVSYMGDQPSPRVEVGFAPNGAGGSLYVRDNGIGIDPRYHEQVFGLFERLDPGKDGTGVGLALAKRIVELHGGRIWVRSEGAGRGSTFYFTLRYLRSETDEKLA